MKPLTRFCKKCFSFFTIFLVSVLVAMIIMFYNLHLLTLKTEDNNQSFTANIDILKKNCHEMIIDYLEFTNDHFKQFKITEDDFRDLKHDKMTKTLYKLLSRLKKENIYVNINLSYNVMRIYNSQNIIIDEFILKDLDRKTYQNIKISELFEKHVYWREDEIPNDIDNFLEDFSVFIMQKVPLKFETITMNSIILATADKAKAYNCNFIGWLFGMTEDEYLSFFDKKECFTGEIQYNRLKIRSTSLNLTIDFPLKYKSEYQRSENRYDSDKIDLLMNMKIETLIKNEDLSKLKEYFQIFRDSTFLADIKQRNFVNFGSGHIQLFLFATPPNKIYSKISYFSYEIPNYETADYNKTIN